MALYPKAEVNDSNLGPLRNRGGLFSAIYLIVIKMIFYKWNWIVNKAPAIRLAESPLARKNLAQGGSRKSHTAKPLLVLWFYSRNKIFYWNTGIAYPQLDEVLNVDSCICDIFNRLRNSNSTFLSLFFSSFPFCCAFIGASYSEGALRAGLAQLGEQ